MTIKKIEYLVLNEETGEEYMATFEPYYQAFNEFATFLFRVTVYIPGFLPLSFPANSYENGVEDTIGFIKLAIKHFEGS